MSYLKTQRIVQPLPEAAYILLPCVLGLAASKVTDFGRGVGDQFFVVLAQVLPVLLLAVVVETALASRALLDRAVTPESQRFVIGALRIQVIVFAIAEGGLLCALSEREATTFLVVMPTAVALMFLLDMVGAIERRLGLLEFHVEKLEDEWEARTLKRVARLHRISAKLAKKADRVEARLADDARGEEPRERTHKRVVELRRSADVFAKKANRLAEELADDVAAGEGTSDGAA